VTTKYREQVVGADRAALDRVERLRREVEALAARLADQAERQERRRGQLGKPCVWGASGPSSYDCSGLVMAAYRSAGVWLPRVSRAQWHAGPASALAASPRATWCSSPRHG
jgi:hypothetical protein